MSIDKLTDKLAEIASAMQGPGLEAAKGAAAAEAMSILAGGALCGLAAVGFAYVMRWSWRRLQATGDYEEGAQLYYVLLTGGSALLVAILGSRAVWAFADPWTWITLTQPELWLAKRALGL